MGLSGSYFDDITRAGKKNFKNEFDEKTKTRFHSKPNEEVPSSFTSIQVLGNVSYPKNSLLKLYISNLLH